MPQLPCGMGAATAAYAARCLVTETVHERILFGLLFPKTVEMALVSRLDPLEAALDVYRQLPFAPEWMILRYAYMLERKNARIIERDRLRYLEEKRARHTPKDGRARGTRSTRSHGKTKSGRR